MNIPPIVFAPDDRQAFIVLRSISKQYWRDYQAHTILERVSLQIKQGESCAILGASGSGKSTLLNILGLLDLPDSGDYFISNQRVADLNHSQLAVLRNQQIGFVFQSFNLLAHFTALENVALPLNYRGVPRREALERAQHLLDLVGLTQRSHFRPADLSGGQRQRVAIARALVGEPRLILADEPTGNLDTDTAQEIIDLLLTINREQQTTLVVVTHAPSIAAQMSRQILVENGSVSEAGRPCTSH
ncbi:ABC transporter ATP-binding protein [Pseudomonas sp. 65/3-MNA-CIBAN-0223]|uniref:ABC transporter ATP-binding protein n=1 Tax=Pseudomonas sp. 65/3-MNA-CIBAN-0223 TaxID=3140476 RepID=UPI003320FB2D